MMGLFRKKAEARPRTHVSRARVSVEALEGRELMAARFTIADTLNARDTINIQELNVLGSIENLKINAIGQFQQVIADGQARSNALATQFSALVAQEQAAAAAGNTQAVLAIRQQEGVVFHMGMQVRGLMRQATVLENTIQTTLTQNENLVVRTFNNTQWNLSRGNNPFLTVPHAVNALNAIGAMAQQHATSGSMAMGAIDARINGMLPLA